MKITRSRRDECATHVPLRSSPHILCVGYFFQTDIKSGVRCLFPFFLCVQLLSLSFFKIHLTLTCSSRSITLLHHPQYHLLCSMQIFKIAQIFCHLRHGKHRVVFSPPRGGKSPPCRTRASCGCLTGLLPLVCLSCRRASPHPWGWLLSPLQSTRGRLAKSERSANLQHSGGWTDPPP